MTVLLIRPAASGGLAAHVDQELALLRSAGRDVDEAPVRIGERPAPLADLRTVRTLRRLLRRADSPVTVHAHGLRAGALGALSTPRGRHRLVVTLHNRSVGSPATRAVGAVLLHLLCRRADTVLAVSPDLAEDARRAGATDVRHAVIPAPEREGRAGAAAEPAADGVETGANPGDADSGDGTLEDRTFGGAPPAARVRGDEGGPDRLEILVIARLAPQKGLHDLLDAAALLPGAPHGPRAGAHEVRIRVAGDGPQHAELAARIRTEQLPVELLGRREDVPALLASCDLAVSAARWEGQPVSLQEALRAGRAIVATDAGGTRWVTGQAAQLVPVGDPRALAAAITAMGEPTRREAAEAASRARAEELPTAADLLAQLDEVVDVPTSDW